MKAAWRRFWFEGDEGDRAAVFRVAFFALFALDAWNQVAHASRYGAGRFNVSHFPALDLWLPMPQASGVLIATILQAWLALRVALGVGLRGSLTALTLLFGWTYFSSQLDSYQHHYLLFLCLAWLTGASWLEPGRPAELPTWGLRLLRAQMSALYLWATVAKLDRQWFSGETLTLQITPGWAREAVDSMAQSLGVEGLQLYAAASVATIGLELLLAIAWQAPRLWRFILVPGVLFHLGIEALSFEIGLFSYFMVAAYALVLPDALVRPLARGGRALAGATLGRLPEVPGAASRLGAAAFVALATVYLPIDNAAILAACLAGFALATPAGVRGAAAQGLAMLAVLVLHAKTDALRDHYRYMGGDARRRGDLPTAIAAYERAVRLDPAYASAQVRLGDLYLRDGRAEEAMRAWTTALELEPNNTDALRRIVATQDRIGRPDPELERRLRALGSGGGAASDDEADR